MSKVHNSRVNKNIYGKINGIQQANFNLNDPFTLNDQLSLSKYLSQSNSCGIP